MIDLIVRQGTMNYKMKPRKVMIKRPKPFSLLFSMAVVFFLANEKGHTRTLFNCDDGGYKRVKLLELRFESEKKKESYHFRFQILPYRTKGKFNESVSSFLKNWGLSKKEFQNPIFELNLKARYCRVEKDSGPPLIDCFLPKGTTFLVRDRLNKKKRKGVLSWGQFHLRKQTETFIMFRSEDGLFKKRDERLKLFFTGQNTKGEISRIDSLYDKRFCHWF